MNAGRWIAADAIHVTMIEMSIKSFAREWSFS